MIRALCGWLAAALMAGMALAGNGSEPKVLPAQEAQPPKVLRLAFRTAETGFDPAKVNDIYSLAVNSHIFEALYAYDHLARPAKIKPKLAVGMPEPSSDFKVWTAKLRPGIYFQSDPAFKGQKREVVAQDVLYAFKRLADPINKSPNWGVIDASAGFVGLAEARKAALDARKPFDYDAPIDGLKALDRYTVQFMLRESRPRFHLLLAWPEVAGIQAREVAEFYGDKIEAHPVGTGPFKLKQWRRSSLIVLERNPEYRDERWDAEPAGDDVDGQAMLARLKGRKLPLVDEVQISIIEEAQPYWLAFLNGDLDTAVAKTGAVPGEYVNQAAPNGKLAPNLAKQGIEMRRQANPDSAYVYFNMDDPVLGGYTPDRVALRRAIGLAMDVPKLIRVGYRGQAIAAQGLIAPHVTGYDAQLKTEMGDHDPARAKALLDLYGYKDIDGDGWRETPDGKPLAIEQATQPDQISREFEGLWNQSLRAVGLRPKTVYGQWPEQLKQARAGKLPLWFLGGSATNPDGLGLLMRLDSTQAGGQNLARFKSDEADAIYKQLSALPDGP